MRSLVLLLVCTLAAICQSLTAPVIYPRGVTDAVRQDPAPATVARGAALQISGFNLGPETVLKAEDTPLPTKLGDPEVQVLINGEAVGLYSISAGVILAQVPDDATLGIATVVVSVGGVKSEGRTFTVAALQPGIVTADGSGYGRARGDFSRTPVVVTGSGFGVANPRAGTVVAYIGGAPARVTTQLNRAVPGQFNAQIEVPGSARPGDLLNLTVNARSSNLVTLQPLAAPSVDYLAFPEGSSDLAGLTTPDVDGRYVLGIAAKDTKGCFPVYSFDFSALKSAKGNPCLIASAANAVSPFINAAGTEFVGALVGPSLGTAPAGIAKQAVIVQPGKPDRIIDLTGAAANLVSAPGGTFTATIPSATEGGTATVDTITASTGAVRNAPPAAPANGAAAGNGAGQVAAAIEVDGLSKLLTNRIGLPGGLGAVVVGDSATAPAKFVFAVVKANGEKVSATAFPAGYVPLLAPAAPPQTAPGGGGGGAPAPAAQVAAPAGLGFYLASQKQVLVAAKKADDSAHALLAFPVDGAEAVVQALPNGWFLAACTNNLRTFNVVLTGAIALFGSNSAENTYKASCPASGYITVETESGEINAVSAGQNVDMVYGGSVGAVNDFVWATNLSATTRTSSSIYVFDGANRAAQRLELPTGVNAIQTPSAIPALSALIATAQRRAVGDDGFVIFDLDAGTSRHLAVPEGFGSVSLVGFFPATRKLVARGISTDRRTSGLIVYDLEGKEVFVVKNPEGVASIGSRPGVGVAARQLVTSPNANTVAGIGYDADGKQVGVVSVRIP